ncbi:MAG: hypothetical protein ACJ73D_02685 [Pyrinomonadaceae bacterium]
MDTSTPATNRLLFGSCGVAFLIPSIFFTYYTIRLIYVNLSMDDAAAHRTGGMLIGAVAFPVAALICGGISWLFLRKASRPSWTPK